MAGAFQHFRTALAGTTVMLSAASTGKAAQTVPPTRIGITATAVVWYSGDQPFANLAIGDVWTHAAPSGWKPLDRKYLGPQGELVAVPTDGDVVKMLVRPHTGPAGITIRCTYLGTAEITVKGVNITNASSRPGSLSFRWLNSWKNEVVWIQVHSVRPGAPLRNLDCRNIASPPGATFEPSYVDMLRGYKIVRFLDWQRTNLNEPSIRWSERRTVSAPDYISADGVPVEHMIDLANMIDADAWFCMPWGADEDYVRRFAEMVRDKLAPDRKVYVELSNEVWNWAFPVAKLASQEGRALGLSTNAQEAQQRRYAQRLVSMMKIWETVFAAQKDRLVRVVSTQDVNPRVAEIVFAAPDVVAHSDALATAPYFGWDLMKEGQTDDLTELFRRLNQRIEKSLDSALNNKAIAQRFGKRYITYEAGQHVVIPYDVTLEERIQRDPRMAELYRRYIDSWRKRVGDVLMMFGTAGPIGKGGAWGMVEHIGQTPAEAPKLRAMQEELKIQ